MGHVQTLANGRRQARYRGPDGKEQTKVFDRERDALAHIGANEVSKVRRPDVARRPSRWKREEDESDDGER